MVGICGAFVRELGGWKPERAKRNLPGAWRRLGGGYDLHPPRTGLGRL